MTGGLPYATTYLPIGTVVNALVIFDVGPGTPNTYPNITSITGVFSWNDGISREFIIDRLSGQGLGADGWINLTFGGTGPTIEELTVEQFSITYNLGVNPFTTTQQLSDLLLSSMIMDFSIMVSSQLTGHGGNLTTDVSGFVTPEPATLYLLALGGFTVRLRKSR